MASIDSGRPPQRDTLPPIHHPDFEKSRLEKNDHPRFSTMPNLSISTAPLASPTTIYSGPPPPYSCAPSTTDSGHGLSGYFSPPLSSAKTLPSLHEALGGDKSVPFSGPPSVTYSHQPGSAPTTAVGKAFPDAPRGPLNPFSQSIPPPPLTAAHPDPANSHGNGLVNPPTEPNHPRSQSYSSPIIASSNAHRSSAGSFSSVNRPFEPINHPPYAVEQNSHKPSFQDSLPQPPPPPPPPPPPHQPTSFSFEPSVKFDDSRNPFVQSNPQAPYGDTVKRHLDRFDAELSLNEVHETSTRTVEFSRSWAHRFHSSNRSGYLVDSAPSIQEIDEMLGYQQRLLDHLNGLREAVALQQAALSEQRARAAATRGHMEEEYHVMHDDYKTGGGFAGGDAKKRRGKAAPPGRCHSCNRAETPEWRRGPDGARTLCNACGLHYAKLTRKLGSNKANALTGSNLRPKNLDARPGPL